jgi:tetratricopeptide (TPR) repeat protein
MDWREAANDFPILELSDLTRLRLSKDDQEYVLSQFNRAIMNAKADNADIAMITLKKLLTQYPNWGEAALLYGICMAMDGKLRRAGASFQHAISAGLINESLTYAAQLYYRDAGVQFAKEKHAHAEMEDETAKKGRVSSIFQQRKNPVPYRDSDSAERVHMQAPILMKVPRSSGKSKIASDRERIEVMMQSKSSNGEIPDDEIDVSIPKTPAEKLRIAFITFTVVLLAVFLALLTWYVIIPWVSTLREDNSASARLTYLMTELDKQKGDPQVSQIISDYEIAFPPAKTSVSASPVTEPQATVPATTASQPTITQTPITQAPITQAPITPTPTTP